MTLTILFNWMTASHFVERDMKMTYDIARDDLVYFDSLSIAVLHLL